MSKKRTSSSHVKHAADGKFTATRGRTAPVAFAPSVQRSGRSTAPASGTAHVPPALRRTLDQLAKVGIVPFEAPRLRAEVRRLQRQVAAQAQQIQLLATQQGVSPSGGQKSSGSGRAARAMRDWEARLADQPTPDTQSNSEAARRQWVEDGLVIASSVLAGAWGQSRQALDQARTRGDLVGIKIGHLLYYPSAFGDLAAADVAAVCQVLRDIDPVSQTIFWLRTHPSLDDRTLGQAINDEGLDVAVQAAEAFADEHARVAPLVETEALAGRKARLA